MAVDKWTEERCPLIYSHYYCSALNEKGTFLLEVDRNQFREPDPTIFHSENPVHELPYEKLSGSM